jgi:hypothetical protein
MVFCGGLMLAELADTHHRPAAQGRAALAGLSLSPGAETCLGPPTDQEEGDSRQAGKDEFGPAAGLRKLTPKEINRIRFMELRGMRLDTSQPDRVKVKVPKQTVDDYLAERAADPLFRSETEAEMERQRRSFRKLTAAQKLHWIAQNTGTEYVDRVEILSDPEIFVTFKKNVQPVVLRSCAKQPGCHSADGEDDRLRFRLFSDPQKTPATTYANFIMLSDIVAEGGWLIDRPRPADSLLLTYMLPAKEVTAKLRHPGEIESQPTFRTRKAPGWRRIQKWIFSLKYPAEEYGVRLVPPPDDLQPVTEERPPTPDQPRQPPSDHDPDKAGR